MTKIILRTGDPGRDFALLSVWFSSIEEERTSESQLHDYYAKQKHRIVFQTAFNETGQCVGFHWFARDRVKPERAHITVFVAPGWRGQGIGQMLYTDLEKCAHRAGAAQLRVNVSDQCAQCRTFAEKRGFREYTHQFSMQLDLDTLDDSVWDADISRLKDEGFRFTSMEEMGNSEEAQRKLYLLNDTAAATTPGTNGEHPWSSFEDFQESVCRADWYMPAGQIVAIDQTNGAFAAMSAITKVKGNDYAYNLFTGVDMPYRGRKLGQAVKVLALRFAREVLNVHKVRTEHNLKNDPMIAIDRKLGYRALPGYFLMEKELTGSKAT